MIRQKSPLLRVFPKKISTERSLFTAGFYLWNFSFSALFRGESALFRDFQVTNSTESEQKHFWIRADQCWMSLRRQPGKAFAKKFDWGVNTDRLGDQILVSSRYHESLLREQRHPNLHLCNRNFCILAVNSEKERRNALNWMFFKVLNCNENLKSPLQCYNGVWRKSMYSTLASYSSWNFKIVLNIPFCGKLFHFNDISTSCLDVEKPRFLLNWYSIKTQCI